jgi:hypothetical protein
VDDVGVGATAVQPDPGRRLGLRVAAVRAGLLVSTSPAPLGLCAPNNDAAPWEWVGTVSPLMSMMVATASRWRRPRLRAQYPPADMPAKMRPSRSGWVRSMESIVGWFAISMWLWRRHVVHDEADWQRRRAFGTYQTPLPAESRSRGGHVDKAGHVT